MKSERHYTQIFTPANVVTTVRIALVPVFVVIILAPWPSWFHDIEVTLMLEGLKPFIAALVFALLALTDTVDGYLARSRNEVTTLGKFLDPLADKILITAALLALIELRLLPAWVALVIMTREFLVSGLRMVASVEGNVIAASVLGKLKTIFQIIAVLLFIIIGSPYVNELAEPIPEVLYYVSWTIMIIAIALTLLSLADYFFKSSAALGIPLKKPVEDGGEDLSEGSGPSQGFFADAQNDISECPPETPRPPEPPCHPERSEGSESSQRFFANAQNDISECPPETPRPPEPPCHSERSEGSDEPFSATPAAVVELARARGMTIGTAESCTGGLVASALTEVPGASAAFLGTVVSYTNEVKTDVLGVSREVLDTWGAVSAQTAEAMAQGALETLGVNAALSVTGIAGPDGGSALKPVGTVWFAYAQACDTQSNKEKGSADKTVHSEMHHFSGTREEIRAKATAQALRIFVEYLQSDKNQV